jgi:hypothetical protein
VPARAARIPARPDLSCACTRTSELGGEVVVARALADPSAPAQVPCVSQVPRASRAESRKSARDVNCSRAFWQNIRAFPARGLGQLNAFICPKSALALLHSLTIRDWISNMFLPNLSFTLAPYAFS